MYSFLRSALLVCIGVFVAIGVTVLPGRAAGGEKALKKRVKDLEATVATLESKLAYMHVAQGPINGLKGPHVIFTGCNVHVRSGSGETVDGTIDLETGQPLDFEPFGLGNLVIGYNELPIFSETTGRTGSHNLVTGLGHSFTNVGGGLFGQENTVSGALSSVTGGFQNAASGPASVVSGGQENIAEGLAACVSSGLENKASGAYASASGGRRNTASGESAHVTGGTSNTASGEISSVSGSSTSVADGLGSSVSGGSFNQASGTSASVSGGQGNKALGTVSSASGGFGRTASGTDDWVAGGLSQDS